MCRAMIVEFFGADTATHIVLLVIDLFASSPQSVQLYVVTVLLSLSCP